MELFLLLITGAAAGLIAGLVGLAGGIVVVPALTWMYGPQALHSAIVISWFSVLFNSFSAASKHWRLRTGAERRELFLASRWYLLGAIVVTPAIAASASTGSGIVTPVLVAVLQLCLAVVMLWPVEDKERTRRDLPARDATFGGAIAAVSTLIGVGGGTYTIAYFVYGPGIRFRDAIATANFAGFTVGMLSVFGYLLALAVAPVAASSMLGPIGAWGTVAVILGGVLAAPVGVRLSRELPVRTLRHILIAVLIVSALRLMMT